MSELVNDDQGIERDIQPIYTPYKPGHVAVYEGNLVVRGPDGTPESVQAHLELQLSPSVDFRATIRSDNSRAFDIQLRSDQFPKIELPSAALLDPPGIELPETDALVSWDTPASPITAGSVSEVSRFVLHGIGPLLTGPAQSQQVSFTLCDWDFRLTVGDDAEA